MLTLFDVWVRRIHGSFVFELEGEFVVASSWRRLFGANGRISGTMSDPTRLLTRCLGFDGVLVDVRVVGKEDDED